MVCVCGYIYKCRFRKVKCEEIHTYYLSPFVINVPNISRKSNSRVKVIIVGLLLYNVLIQNMELLSSTLCESCHQTTSYLTVVNIIYSLLHIAMTHIQLQRSDVRICSLGCQFKCKQNVQNRVKYIKHEIH